MSSKNGFNANTQKKGLLLVHACKSSIYHMQETYGFFNKTNKILP